MHSDNWHQQVTEAHLKICEDLWGHHKSISLCSSFLKNEALLKINRYLKSSICLAK